MIRPSLHAMRRTVQVLIALVMALVPSLNALGWNSLSGNFLAFNAFGLPLADPLAVLQTVVSSFDMAAKAAVGGSLALAIAFCLGPVFCSWVCPYGFVSELVQSVRSCLWIRERTAMRRNGFPGRATFAGATLVLVGTLGWPPVLNQLSMPGWYSRIFQMWTLQAILTPALGFMAAALLLELALGRRLWCRYVCPQSLLLALARRFSPVALRVGFTPGRCTCSRGEEACAKACSLGLEPRRKKGLALECSNCGDCIEACRKRGKALHFAMGRTEKRSP